jgi:hypothetical protein
MSIEVVVEIFYYLKKARDNYNDNQEASLLLVNRLSCLEDPLLKFQSHSVEISKDSVETLEEVLSGVKDILDVYNTSSMCQSFLRAIRSGKYAEDFRKANELIDRALQTVGLSLDISNEERRQQDVDSMKQSISNLSKYIIRDMREHMDANNEDEKRRSESILNEVKALSAGQSDIIQHFLQVVGHTDCELSVEEKADFVEMHEEVEELITACVDKLSEEITDLKDNMDEMKKEILNALLDNKSESMGEAKKAILKAKLAELYNAVKEKEIAIEGSDGDAAKLGAGGFGSVYAAQ